MLVEHLPRARALLHGDVRLARWSSSATKFMGLNKPFPFKNNIWLNDAWTPAHCISFAK